MQSLECADARLFEEGEGKGFIVRRVEMGDIQQVIDVHLAGFHDFFLSFLGRPFLERLYTEIAKEPGAIFLIACTQEPTVIGFAAGVLHLPSFYRRLLRERWLHFALASLRAVIRRPRILPRLWRALRASDEAREAACPATLMSLAVTPGVKGRGVGRTMLLRFLQDMMRHGVNRVCLTTDRENNGGALAFYEGLGFRATREFSTRWGRPMREYMIDMNPKQSGGRGR